MNQRTAMLGLVVIGVILVVGGVIVAITGTDGPEWLGKAIAIVVGALVALAGGSTIIHHKDSD